MASLLCNGNQFDTQQSYLLHYEFVIFCPHVFISLYKRILWFFLKLVIVSIKSTHFLEVSS